MTDVERIAKLEARAEEIVRRLGSQDTALEAIRADVHEISQVMSRYKGFAGGIVFAVASVAGLVGALITAIWAKLGS